jgi:hypothetical protein
MGDEPSSSAVEDVEKAGDPGSSGRWDGRSLGPSSATAAGGGDELKEEIVSISAGLCRVSMFRRLEISSVSASETRSLETHHNETSADEVKSSATVSL